MEIKFRSSLRFSDKSTTSSEGTGVSIFMEFKLVSITDSFLSFLIYNLGIGICTLKTLPLFNSLSNLTSPLKVLLIL
jgi:hypothetical protein